MKPPSPIYLLPLLARSAWQAHTIGEEAHALSDDAWDTVVSRPNATGRANVPGYDITLPYPGRPADWSLRVWVQANVPLPGDDLAEDERFTTATEVGFQPPGGTLEHLLESNETEQSWTVCQSFFLSSRLVVEDDEDDVRGDCIGVLSIPCRSGLESAMWNTFIRGDPGSRCSFLPVPECASELDFEDEDEKEFRFDGISGTSGYPLEQTSRGDVVRYAAGNHSVDDTDDYDRAIRQIWVAGIVWGYANESIRNSTGSAERTVSPNLVCVAATSIQEDSRGLEDGASGIRLGDGLGGTTAWAAMIVAAGFMAAMM